MVGLKHYPDKPFERHPRDLQSWDDAGCYVCERKTDGWRLEVLKGLGDDLHFISRHNKAMNVETHIVEQMKILAAAMPDRTQLDCEWMSRRESTNKKIKPYLALIDVVRYNKKWLLRTTYAERRALLEEIYAKVDPALIPNIRLTETAPSGEFVAFYEAQKKLPQSEGVVVKHKESLLLGDRKESKKNPRWFKVKFRQGSDGNMTMDHLW